MLGSVTASGVKTAISIDGILGMKHTKPLFYVGFLNLAFAITRGQAKNNLFF